MPKLIDPPFLRRPEGPDPFAELLTVAEAAPCLGMSVRSVHYGIKDGTIPAWQPGGPRGLFFVSRNGAAADADPFAGMLTVAQAAALTGYSIGAIHYSVQRGLLPAWHRSMLFLLPRAEVEQWFERKHGVTIAAWQAEAAQLAAVGGA